MDKLNKFIADYLAAVIATLFLGSYWCAICAGIGFGIAVLSLMASYRIWGWNPDSAESIIMPTAAIVGAAIGVATYVITLLKDRPWEATEKQRRCQCYTNPHT